MSVLTELIPEAKLLSRVDKLRLIQILAEELAGDEGNGEDGSDMKANPSYSIWSPDSAFQAAEVMLDALEKEKRS